MIIIKEIKADSLQKSKIANMILKMNLESCGLKIARVFFSKLYLSSACFHESVNDFFEGGFNKFRNFSRKFVASFFKFTKLISRAFVKLEHTKWAKFVSLDC